MNCFGKRLCPGIKVFQTGGGKAWRHRTNLLILIVSGVTVLISLSPLGSLLAAQAPDIASATFADSQGKSITTFNGASGAETGPQSVKGRIAPLLQQVIAKSAQARAGRIPQTAAPAKIKIMLQLDAGRTFDPGVITSRGGRVLRHRANLVTAEIPPEQIESVMEAEQGIAFARLPHRFRPLAVTSEGVGLTGAGNFHDSGYRGVGLKVAVIDGGFKGLAQAQSSGDLPMNVMTNDFTGNGLETEHKHGTACAEIIHDMAPDAELHLLKVADEDHFYAAYDYCLQQGIKIISLSIGTFGTGPGNGTGPLQDICNDARAHGILVVAAAGNAANYSSSDGVPIGTHWEGTFTDADQDTIHEFAPGVQGNILLARPAHDDDGNPEHDEVTVVMRWDDWPNAVTDYDLHLYTYDYNTGTRGVLAGSSEGTQSGSQQPVEAIIIDLPDNLPYQSYQFYELEVVRKQDSPAGKKLEIALGGNSVFLSATRYAPPLATSAGSIMEPADAASVFAVGAINSTQWYGGPQENYSSQGPTNDWAGSAARIKPDICGPDGVGSNTYGTSYPGFFGTSAAAPHVAGAAALLWSVHPEMPPGEVQSTLENWAVDMGDTGKDNLCGWGRLRLLTYTLSISIITPFPGSGTISSAPGGINCGNSCSASYPSGTNVTLTATANPGFIFAGWEGAACPGTGPCTVTVDGYKSVSALFDRISYPLSISMAGTGSGTVFDSVYTSCWNTCTSSYYTGTSVTLTATPLSGSTFTGWSDGCSGTGQCTVTMDGPKSVTATFVLNIYSIATPPPANGTISCDPATVTSGSSTTCTITPNTGYHLVALTDNGADVTMAMVDASYKLYYVSSNHTLSATFAINTYTIAAAAGANGGIAPSATVNHGSSATFAITPNANYHVADVLVDGVSVGAVASYTFQNVTASHTISAAFAIDTFTLSVRKAGTGSGIVTGVPGEINCGNACAAAYAVGTEPLVTLAAIPTLGSTFTGWSGGGCTGTGACSLLMNSNRQITALFANPRGDVNEDDKVDLTDAIVTLQVLTTAGGTGRTLPMAADANNDNKIGMEEVIYILQKVAETR